MQETEHPYREEEDSPAFDYGGYDDETQEEDETGEPEKPRGGLRLLTGIQIFGSIAILVTALLLRSFGGDLFQKVRTWYLSAVNDSIIADEQADQAKKTVIGLWNNIAAAGAKSSSTAPGTVSAGTAASGTAGTASSPGSAPASQPGSAQPGAVSSAPASAANSVTP